MPIYEYECSECHSAFEVLVRGKESAACPSCGGRKLERQLTVQAAHTGSRAGDLPVCQPSGGPPCGAGFCRTGQCDVN